MSEESKQWATAVGIVQSFVKDGVRQPAVKAGQTQNGQVVHNFTIQGASQTYVDVALWQEYAHVAPSIQAGFGIMVRGPLTITQGQTGKQFYKINAAELIVVPCVARQEREVVNVAPVQQVAAAPVVQQPAVAPQAAPVATAADNPFAGVSL
jgi:hypothetical protein